MEANLKKLALSPFKKHLRGQFYSSLLGMREAETMQIQERLVTKGNKKWERLRPVIPL